MQLVSDLQQRPKKGRLKVEKRIVLLYDLCSVVEFSVFLIHTVTTMIGASRTFSNYIIRMNDFALAPALMYKTQNCTYNTVRSIYAFQDVNMTFTANSINDVFVDQAIQMRLAIFICAVAFVVGGVNRSLVEANVFVIKYRNFYFWKDILSATELILLAYVAQIAAAIDPPKHLLRDYLRHCGIEGNAYLPFISTINLWVFVGVGYFTYVVGLPIYLNNTLPKYGIMTPAEIEEYKTWLRARRAEQEQSRMLIEEARKAHARIHMMNTADYRLGSGVPVAPASMMPSYPAPMVPGVMEPNQMAYLRPYMYPYPYGGAYPGWMPGAMPPNIAMPGGIPGMPGDPRLPPPQMFGAGMMPIGNTAMMQPQQPPQPPEMPAGAPLLVNEGSQPPINMPRRRIVPSASPSNSPMYP
jgi:hypothetical protein